MTLSQLNFYLLKLLQCFLTVFCSNWCWSVIPCVPLLFECHHPGRPLKKKYVYTTNKSINVFTGEDFSPEDTIIFQLKVKCTKNSQAKDTTDPDEMYKDHKGERSCHRSKVIVKLVWNWSEYWYSNLVNFAPMLNQTCYFLLKMFKVVWFYCICAICTCTLQNVL